MSTTYRNPDNDSRGPWSSGDPYSTGAVIEGTQHPGVYGIQHPITGEMMYPPPGKHWYYGRDRMLAIFSQWGNYRRGAITAQEVAARVAVTGPGVEIRDDVFPLIVYGWQTSHRAAAARYEAGNWPTYYPTHGGAGGFRRKVYPK